MSGHLLPSQSKEGLSAPGFDRSGLLSLGSLTLAVFVLVFSEFLPTGILTSLASDLEISEGAAGQTVSATAIAGMIAALFTPIVIRRADRRHVMLGLAALSVIGNAVPILASDMPTLIIARAATGLAVGGFWALSAGVVGKLFSEANFGRAMGIIMTGVSVATIAAPPTGTFIAMLFGWRAAFGLAFVLSVFALVAQALTLPRLPASKSVRMSTLLTIVRRRSIILIMVTVLAIAGGHFASFTYVRAVLEDVAGLTAITAAAALLAYGGSNFVGSLAGAALADRRLSLLISGVAFTMGVSTLGIVILSHHLAIVIPLICIWGFAFGAAPIALMTWMTRGASDKLEGVGSLFTATFQISVALGAAIGGAVVDRLGVSSTLVMTGFLGLLATVAPVVGNLALHKRATTADVLS